MPDDRHSPPHLRAVPAVPATEVPGNGNGDAHDDRAENPVTPERPYPNPRTPEQIAANASMGSLAYSMRASEWAGQSMAAAKAARDAVKGQADEIRGLREDVDGLRAEHRETAKHVERIARDVTAIAQGLGGSRTVSSDTLRLDLSAAVPPSLKTTRSPTGSHLEIAKEEADRIVMQVAELQEANRRKDEEKALEAARAQGAEEALENMKLETAAAEKKKLDDATAALATEKKWRARITFGLLCGGAAGTGVAFLLRHFH